MLRKCCCKTEGDDARKIEKEDEIGKWVDLSGQEQYNLYKTKDSVNQNDDIELNSLLSLDETEKVVLDAIKQSFPYYRNYQVA